MFSFVYNYTDYGKLVHEMASRMQVQVHNDCLHIPELYGSGKVCFVKLPNGLHCNIINCTLNVDWLLHRKKSTEEFYTLRFDELMFSGPLVITVDEDKVQEKNSSKALAYLTSSLLDWSYYGTKGSSFKGINILFNKEWLARYLDINSVEEVMVAYLALKADNINIEPLDAKYRRWMTTICETDRSHPLWITIVQNRIMLLIERFFENLYKKMNNPAFRTTLTADDIRRVMKIESILTKDVFQPPPSIIELAKIASVSESKLKKDFKTMYGKPIFEYFQKARMEAAQDRLLTGQYSVKEVAMELGYSNLSNFTIAFKKQFGILPSQLLSAS